MGGFDIPEKQMILRFFVAASVRVGMKLDLGTARVSFTPAAGWLVALGIVIMVLASTNVFELEYSPSRRTKIVHVNGEGK